MKNKIFLVIVISILTLITGCSSEEELNNILVCENLTEKYVLNLDDTGEVNSIYYEENINLRDNYTDEQIAEFEIYNFVLPSILEQYMANCNQASYACNSSYANLFITNKYYIDNREDAQLVDFDEYLGINYVDARSRIVVNEDVTCKEVQSSEIYIVSGNSVDIDIDGVKYSSIEDMMYEVNKPKYYQEYNLFEDNGRTATIEFKENGVCEIDLSDFDADTWSSRTYCEEDKKIMDKRTYLNGNCSYEVINDYDLTITYDGEYETYKYCDSENYKINKLFYDVVDNNSHVIKIRFNQNYSGFDYQNGNWEFKSNGRGALEYKSN